MQQSAASMVNDLSHGVFSYITLFAYAELLGAYGLRPTAYSPPKKGP